MPVFFWFCLLIKPLHRANHPRLKTSFGSGNFFMLRRKVLEKTGGFSTIKNEITEDLKLAEIIKERGFRLRAEYAPNLIRTRMYMGFSEIWEGFTKNLFPALKFSFIPLFSAYLLQVFVFFLIQREMSQNFFYAFLVPLGLLMFLAILMNSALRVRGGKGVTWKGRTIYKEGGVLPPAG
jgi:cellulose synthase/poly-beta-1,6-N-acetylglucosamine synthase-like glycosyltransferase